MLKKSAAAKLGMPKISFALTPELYSNCCFKARVYSDKTRSGEDIGGGGGGLVASGVETLREIW